MTQTQRIDCLVCGRQIVSYRVSDAYAVGPASDGCMMLVCGYACPECSKVEREYGRLFYEEE